MGVAHIIETVLLFALTVVFLLSSSIKLLPQLFPPELGQMMDQKFQVYCKVCPTVLLGYQPSPLTYKLVVGIVEFAAGLALVLRETRTIGAGILTITMIGAIQTHFCMDEFKDCMVPAVLGLISFYFFVKSMRGGQIGKRKVE